MTDIRIKKLILENFKCHDHLVLDFGGKNASIYGDNATGKTSVYDALTWLLFGKDSLGNSNIEIKPLDQEGNIRDHLAVTAVEAVLLVNGEETTLRRTYKEVWATKRGSSEAEYNGNTSEYYVDGVPCKRNAFLDKVRELVEEETFHMLTSVSHFAAGISWQDRRAALFKVAGVLDDVHILATDPRFQPLVDAMGRLNLEDLKKKLLAEKKGLEGAKTDIPARISERQQEIDDLCGLDYERSKQEAAKLEREQDALASRILAIEQNSEAERLRMDIRAARLDLEKLESENRAFRTAQTAGIVDTDGLLREMAGIKARVSNKRTLLDRALESIAVREKQIAEFRERWISISGESFSGGLCPTCAQPLPAKQYQAAVNSFEAQKQSRLRSVEQMAENHKRSKVQEEVRVKELEEEIRDLEERAAKIQAKLDAAGTPVEIQDMEGYQVQKSGIQDRIESLSVQLQQLTQDAFSVKEDLRQEMERIKIKLRNAVGIIQKESLLRFSQQRIEELRQDAKAAAQKLEAIEKLLFLMKEYTRYKTQFVEDSVNGLFRIARFRLFRVQANGGIEDRCDVVYDGVPYMGLNNGMKINVGIDIINTLSQTYGVRVPLFIDNAEGVTRLEQSEAQVIRLFVSESDKELRCVNEA